MKLEDAAFQRCQWDEWTALRRELDLDARISHGDVGEIIDDTLAPSMVSITVAAPQSARVHFVLGRVCEIHIEDFGEFFEFVETTVLHPDSGLCALGRLVLTAEVRITRRLFGRIHRARLRPPGGEWGYQMVMTGYDETRPRRDDTVFRPVVPIDE